MSLRVRTEGGGRLQSLPSRLSRASRDATRESLWELGGRILRRAQELVPVDTGNLRASGYVGQVRVEGPGGERQSVTVGFDAPYAEEQEENETYRHRVGQAHYLRDATIEVSGDALPIVKRELNGAIRRGSR